MKKFPALCVLALFLAAGCSKEDSGLNPAAVEDESVTVAFRMETPFDTETSLEPMTRSTAYVNWLWNQCKALILKKTDGKWIVDGTQTILLEANSSLFYEIKLSGDLPPCTFGFEMRPGDYRVVAIVNPQVASWNTALTPGTVVADEREVALKTQPLMTYTVSSHPANRGYRMLTREVFVAVADFTVPKSGDLHATGMAPVELNAVRRVGKFRFLLKDKPSPQYGLTFQRTAHTFHGVFTSDRPFAEGIDALGGMYYSEPGLYQLPWCMSTRGEFHLSNGERYQLCHTHSTVFSPFLFFDPAQEEQAFEISEIRITGASGGFTYRTDRVFSRTLGASRITGIVFQTNDQVDDSSSQVQVGLDEATDEKGEPERAELLFDPFYEWNAATDNTLQQ